MGEQLIALSIPVFILSMGVELAVSRRKGLVVYRLGDAMGDLGCGIGRELVTGLVGTAVTLASYEWVYQRRLVELPGVVLPWIIATLGYDLAYYWWHRLSHEVNILWAAHAVHHQSEDFNLAVALRQSATTWVTSLPFYLPLALLGVSTSVFAVTAAISLIYQFFVHTELVRDLGAVDRVLNTPALHRVHHAINPRYLDRNHAAIFTFWDQLFGTFIKEDERCVYGTTRPLRSYNPLWAQVQPYVDLWQLSRRAPTRLDALKVWVASPAWRPAWMGEGAKRDGEAKYDPPAPPAVRRYAQLHAVVALLGVGAFIMFGHSLTWASKAVAIALIVLSLAALPALVEGKPWAPRLERVRLFALPLLALIAVFR